MKSVSDQYQYIQLLQNVLDKVFGEYFDRLKNEDSEELVETLTTNFQEYLEPINAVVRNFI